MMTKPQQYIMELLADYRCLRVRHIERLMKAQYSFSAGKTAVILNQLKYMGKIRLTGDGLADSGLAALPYSEPRAAVLAAFDVMIDLCGGKCVGISSREPPFTLFFTADDGSDGKRFAIIAEGTESQIRRSVKLLKNKNITIILVLGDLSQAGGIVDAPFCYYAMSDGNGKYRYFRQ